MKKFKQTLISWILVLSVVVSSQTVVFALNGGNHRVGE